MRLRPLEVGDAAAFAEGASDAAVRRHAHLPEPDHTPDSVRAMVEREVRPGLARGDLAVLTIAEAATDAFAGSLVLFDVEDRAAEVGFWLHPGHRGRQLTSAAVRLASRFAADSGLVRLRARTAPENVASQRVLEGAGFTLRQRAQGTAPSGERVELFSYELMVAGRRQSIDEPHRAPERQAARPGTASA